MIIVWSLGESVVLFCVKIIAMGELEISVEAAAVGRLGVGGASSFTMSHGTSLWPIGEASNAKDFAPQWGFLEKGCTLPATWRRQRPICQVGLLSKQVCGKAKKGVVVKVNEGAPRQRHCG
jgi:hypothetical protein